MNFSKNDMYILVGSFAVIVFMSLVFPALGMANDNDSANESDIPSLDITESTVDFAGDRPEFPRTSTSGELKYEVGNPTETRQDKLHSDGENEVFVETFCDSDDPVNGDCHVTLTVFDSGGYVDSDSLIVNKSDFDNDTITTLSADDNDSNTWQTTIEFTYVQDWNTSDVDYRIQWEIVEKPGTSGIESIPIVGGIYSTADAVASILAWGITVFFWFCTWFVELVLNVLGMLVKLFIFGIRIVSYMVSNYNGMLDSVTGFATFILTIPVILLTVELLKLGFIFIKILPTT